MRKLQNKPWTSGLLAFCLLIFGVSTGIAQQVSHLYFYAATTLTDSDLALAINKAVSQNKVKAFNMSFGECEFSPYIDGAMLIDDQIFGEAALQGIVELLSPLLVGGDRGVLEAGLRVCKRSSVLVLG